MNPRAGHRLDHRPHPLALEALGEMAQPVRIRRRGGLLDELAGVVDQADVDPASTQIQSSVQHKDGPPRSSLPR
jgi:hypothetical protein